MVIFIGLIIIFFFIILVFIAGIEGELERERKQNAKINKQNLPLEIPNSAFGIYKEDQISQHSIKKVDLRFAQHEISVPKPHSMMDKYYADVWKDNNQLRSIYGISRIFNLENQDDQQVEITDLFLRLKKQLLIKYGPQKRDLDVTTLLITNDLQPKKLQKSKTYFIRSY